MNRNPNRVSNYTPYLEVLNMENIKLPVSIDSIKKFEKEKENIAINIFGVEEELLDPKDSKFNKSKQEKKSKKYIPDVKK